MVEEDNNMLLCVADRQSICKSILLAIQHVCTMFEATISYFFGCK